MKRMNEQILGGALLVAGGVLLLLLNLGLLGGGELIVALLFALGGLAFVALYLQDRSRWWAFIPAGALLGIAAPIALSTVGGRAEELGGGAFLATLGLGFAAVYLGDRIARWWALIPAGTLITLGVVASLSTFGTEADEVGGAVFFLGMALTFFGVALLPHGDKRREWALFPAIACLGLGVIIVATTATAFTIVAAVGLIGMGVYLLYRTRRAERW